MVGVFPMSPLSAPGDCPNENLISEPDAEKGCPFSRLSLFNVATKKSIVCIYSNSLLYSAAVVNVDWILDVGWIPAPAFVQQHGVSDQSAEAWQVGRLPQRLKSYNLPADVLHAAPSGFFLSSDLRLALTSAFRLSPPSTFRPFRTSQSPS